MKHRTAELLREKTADSDFVVRRRRPLLWQIPLLFIVTFSTIYLAASSIETPTGKLVFIATLAIVIGAMSWFTVWFTQRNRDMLLVTEFQNALFASAASLSTRFCVIARRDGTIVYFDPGFQKVFPSFMRNDLRTIDALLEHENVGKHAIHVVLSTMENEESSHTVMPLKLPSGQDVSMMVTIDALPRPKGYFLFRGREYVAHRKEDSKTSASNTLKHMADTLPLGVYTLSPEGTFDFINYTLESWLGYERGEVTRSGLRLLDIMADNSFEQDPSLEDFQQEITLRCKNGKPVKYHVTQQRVSADGVEPQGATGVVTALEDNSQLKKKLNF